MLIRFVDRLYRVNLGRGAVKSLEYAMLAMLVALAAAGTVSEHHTQPAQPQVSQTAQ